MAKQPKAAPIVAEAGNIDLEAFIAMHEAEAQKSGLVVTKLTHPDGVERIYPGVYAGIPIEQGELSATYSDGSKH